MKKIIAVMFAMCVFGASAFADKKADIKKMLTLADTGSMVNQVIDSLIPQYQQMLTDVPADWWKKCSNKMKSTSGDLINELVPIYDKYYTESDIKELVKFYESAIGKKMVKTQSSIMQDSMAVGQKWGQKIGEEIVQELTNDGYIK